MPVEKPKLENVMNTQNIKAIPLMLLAALSLGSANAGVIFSDNFEAQTLGAHLGTSGYTAVPTGLQWYQGGDPAGAFVTNSPALGTQSLALSRLSGGSPSLFAQAQAEPRDLARTSNSLGTSTGAAMTAPRSILTKGAARWVDSSSMVRAIMRF